MAAKRSPGTRHRARRDARAGRNRRQIFCPGGRVSGAERPPGYVGLAGIQRGENQRRGGAALPRAAAHRSRGIDRAATAPTVVVATTNGLPAARWRRPDIGRCTGSMRSRCTCRPAAHETGCDGHRPAPIGGAEGQLWELVRGIISVARAGGVCAEIEVGRCNNDSKPRAYRLERIPGRRSARATTGRSLPARRWSWCTRGFHRQRLRGVARVLGCGRRW